MRRKLIAVLALCFFTSSPLSAASNCPYHWLLATIGAAQAVLYVAPEYRVPIRVLQGAAVLGFVGFSARYVFETLFSETKADEKKSKS